MLCTEISPEICSRLFNLKLGHCACSSEQIRKVGRKQHLLLRAKLAAIRLPHPETEISSVYFQ